MTLYQKFEHAVILLLTGLIAVVVALAVWNLALKVVTSIVSSGFDPTDYTVFQSLFGMIFTVIIALEFKRSLLVVAERQHGIVQVRTVILIALLADRAQADDHRSLQHGCAAAVRARGGDPGARRRVLARPRTGQPRPGLDSHSSHGNRRFAMTIRKLEKSEWHPFLDRLSKLLPAKQAEIEVARSTSATRCKRNGCR